LDQRRAYELYKILRDRQAQADTAGDPYEVLPEAYRSKTVVNAYSMTPADIAVLAAHVDILRKQAGVTVDVSDDEDGGEHKHTVKDKKLAAYVRGVKKSSLDKAYRWLGQQFIKHIFRAWNDAEKPASTKPSEDAKDEPAAVSAA
jgi:hypothetical protein